MVSSSNGAEALTADSPQVLSVFEAELSDEENSPVPAETPHPDDEREDRADPPEAEAKPGSEQGEEQEAEVPEQAEEQSEEQPEQPTSALDPNLKVKVKVDGEEVEVTLDELQKGYSRTSDYTRKTQAVAERNKLLESETQAVRAERQQIAQNLKALEQAVAEITPREPDWERLRVEHPDKFQSMWIEWQQGEKDRQMLAEQRAEAERRVAEDMAAARQEHLKAEVEKLKAAIPEWSKDDVRKADKEAMQKYATETLNIPLEEMNSFTDHRIFVLMRKAMLYDQAQAAKPALIKKVETIRTTKPAGNITPAAPKTDLQKALSRLAKTGSRDDAASVFLHALDD